jgi:hypothetical protein
MKYQLIVREDMMNAIAATGFFVKYRTNYLSTESHPTLRGVKARSRAFLVLMRWPSGESRRSKSWRIEALEPRDLNWRLGKGKDNRREYKAIEEGVKSFDKRFALRLPHPLPASLPP